MLVIGLGYTGERIAHAAAATGWLVMGTSRAATQQRGAMVIDLYYAGLLAIEV